MPKKYKNVAVEFSYKWYFEETSDYGSEIIWSDSVNNAWAEFARKRGIKDAPENASDADDIQWEDAGHLYELRGAAALKTLPIKVIGQIPVNVYAQVESFARKHSTSLSALLSKRLGEVIEEIVEAATTQEKSNKQ